MIPSLQSLGIDRMSRDERLILVQQIWDSIAAETEPTLATAAQLEELKRRAAEDDASPDDAVPWEQVLAEAKSRLHRE